MQNLIFIAALFGFTGVALGAFAAHGLKNHLSPEMLIVFETGARYQMIHAVVLLVLGFYQRISPILSSAFSSASVFFVVGIFLFSGSLYILSLTGIKALGMITPFGGLSFLIGWTFLVLGSFKR